MAGRNSFSAAALRAAREALASGDAPGALEWLQLLPPGDRPTLIVREAHRMAAMASQASADWRGAESHFQAAASAGPPDGYLQTRLAMVRTKRYPSLADIQWQALLVKVDPAKRLSSDACAPELSSVWSCGAYYAWGAARSMPWSKLLRLAKSPGPDSQEHEAAIQLATGFMSRYIIESTDLLRHSEVVVPIPGNPARYADRGMSLPDRLAQGICDELGLPMDLWPLQYVGDVELRGLSWAERAEAIKGVIALGKLGLARGRAVLLVDDVMTSGATLRTAAGVLLSAGATRVDGITLSHVEG